MARTPIIVDRENRVASARFELRLTPVQKAELVKRAKAAKMTLTEYVLSVVFSSK